MSNLRSNFTPIISVNLSINTLWILLACSLFISACGFHIRGPMQLSFNTLSLQGSNLITARELKQSLEMNGIKYVNNVEDADLTIEILSESNDKRISAIGSDGKVSEYSLTYQIMFRTRLAGDPEWSEPKTVQAIQSLSFSDAAILSKANEEVMLINEMHKDALRELIRRLSAIKVIKH